MSEKKVEEKKEVALFEVSMRGIIYDQEAGKILLVKASKDDKEAADWWTLVGGRIDKGETAEDAFKREIKEEVGDIEYEIQDLVHVNIEKRCRVGYLVLYKGGEITLSHEHSEYTWKSFEEIESGDYHLVLKQFIRAAKERIEEKDAVNKWKRALADFENYKKSQLHLQKNLAAVAIEDMVMQTLPVLDNFQMSIEHVPEEQKNLPWVQGLYYIQKQLETVLSDIGVEKIAVSEGDDFDPALHEAIDSTGEASEKTIIKKVSMSGYKMKEKVIRPVRVVTN